MTHELIFMKFTLPQQPFIKKLYSEFRENITHGLVAVSRSHPVYSLHNATLLRKERLQIIKSHNS